MGFDPVSLTAMAAVAGAGVNAVGSYESGVASSKASQYQAQVAANNALIAQQNEGWEEQTGAAKEAAQGQKGRAQIGQTTAAMGASGVTVGSGSFADVVGAEHSLASLDTNTIRSDTARKVYGYEVQQVSDTAQSQLLEAESKQQREMAPISAIGTFLSGASSVGAKFANWQKGAGDPTAPVDASGTASGPDLQGGIWPA